jgi:hypothetical protein
MPIAADTEVGIAPKGRLFPGQLFPTSCATAGNISLMSAHPP